MAGYVPWYDLIAGAVTLGLLAVVSLLAVLQQPCPEILSTAFTVAIGVTFRAGVQAANEWSHRPRRSNHG